MPVPIASGAPPVAPAAAAPPPMPRPGGPSGLTGALLKAGEKIEAQKTAEESGSRVAGRGVRASGPPSPAPLTVGKPGARSGPATARRRPARDDGVRRSSLWCHGGKPPADRRAWPRSPRGVWDVVTDKLLANPLYGKVMAKLDAKRHTAARLAPGALAAPERDRRGPRRTSATACTCRARSRSRTRRWTT
jgi:hypothetical protein